MSNPILHGRFLKLAAEYLHNLPEMFERLQSELENKGGSLARILRDRIHPGEAVLAEHKGRWAELDKLLLTEIASWYANQAEMRIKIPLAPLPPAITDAVSGDALTTPLGAASPSGETAGPLPLTTGDIAYCFNGLRWDEKGWKTSLGNKPKWLKDCIVIPGQRGVSETRWNPVLIGAAMVQRGHVQPRSVRAAFQTKPLLTPWLDAWKTYEADNLDTD